MPGRVADLGGPCHRHQPATPSGWTASCAAAQAPGRPGSSVFFSSWEDDVVVANLENPKLPTGVRRIRADHQPQSQRPARPRAQRVAEGRLLDIHANTWRYNQLIAQQRSIIVDRRNTLLSTPAAREELRELAPERYDELAATYPDAGPRREPGADLPQHHALPPRSRVGGPSGLPLRHPGEHPSAGAGPAEPARRVPTAWPSMRSGHWPPTPSRPPSRPSDRQRGGRREPGLDLSSSRVRPRRGPTWFTTTRCATRHAVGAEFRACSANSDDRFTSCPAGF